MIRAGARGQAAARASVNQAMAGGRALGPGFEDREQSDNWLVITRQAKGDTITRLQTPCSQQMRQLVGL